MTEVGQDRRRIVNSRAATMLTKVEYLHHLKSQEYPLSGKGFVSDQRMGTGSRQAKPVPRASGGA